MNLLSNCIYSFFTIFTFLMKQVVLSLLLLSILGAVSLRNAFVIGMCCVSVCCDYFGHACAPMSMELRAEIF